MSRVIGDRTIAIAFLIVLGPGFMLDGIVDYEIFINSAFARAYTESIALCIISAIMLGIAVTVQPERQKLVAICWMGGLLVAIGSGVFLLILNQPWLASGIDAQWQIPIPFCLALAATVIIRVRQARAYKQ